MYIFSNKKFYAKTFEIPLSLFYKTNTEFTKNTTDSPTIASVTLVPRLTLDKF